MAKEKSTEIVDEEAEARREWEDMKKTNAALKKKFAKELADDKPEEKPPDEKPPDEKPPASAPGIVGFFQEIGLLAKPKIKK